MAAVMIVHSFRCKGRTELRCDFNDSWPFRVFCRNCGNLCDTKDERAAYSSARAHERAYERYEVRCSWLDFVYTEVEPWPR